MEKTENDEFNIVKILPSSTAEDKLTEETGIQGLVCGQKKIQRLERTRRGQCLAERTVNTWGLWRDSRDCGLRYGGVHQGKGVSCLRTYCME